jgi:hypothetical protein
MLRMMSAENDKGRKSAEIRIMTRVIGALQS